MLIGIPAEIVDGENRVAATPETIKKFISKGLHQVIVQKGAGQKSSFPDEARSEERRVGKECRAGGSTNH